MSSRENTPSDNVTSSQTKDGNKTKIMAFKKITYKNISQNYVMLAFILLMGEGKQTIRVKCVKGK